MRYGILSDTHSNLEALEAVLGAVAKEKVEQLLVAGDLVGYGADPCECLKRLQGAGPVAVCGNHDCAAVGKMDLDWFNPRARLAVEWTMEALGPSDRTYLSGLSFVWKNEEVTLVHGSLHEPDQFHYIFDPASSRASFDLQETPVAFFGHTHVPGLFALGESSVSFQRPATVQLERGRRYLVNAGSVGQPRDGDPRAGFCLYDSESRLLEFHRVSYDVQAAQKKIRQAGLPEFLADRLALGY
ncbi:MAG: metallophosphoesterase family protein [Elusimicrobia bacterium]|nr:metallophosphoesterase family protein [Elusimicrobiota bacterium]